MSALLVARDVAARRAGRTVLDGVSLALDAGQVTVAIGPNGAGKSTLVAALAGLLPLSAGTVERHGRVATALQSPALARRSVRANINLALGWWGTPRAQRAGRIGPALEAIGAGHLADRRADTLSGGEARRVHLARALAVEPDILLLDEPFAGLDPTTRAELLYDATSALRSSGRATLVVVHDRAEAWALADRVVVVIAGRIAAEGSTRDVFQRPSSAEVASFVGYSGRLAEGDRLRMFRPADVVLTPAGEVEATVARRIPVEDGVRLELEHPQGRLIAIAPEPGPQIGERVRMTLAGGISVARPAAAEVEFEALPEAPAEPAPGRS